MARPVFWLCVTLLLPATLDAGMPLRPAEPLVLRVLDQWLARYYGGKLDFVGRSDPRQRMRSRRPPPKRARDYVTVSSGLLPESALQGRGLTHERELEILCERLVEVNDVHTVRGLLKVAAVGLDKRKFTPAMKPSAIRALGEQHLAELQDPRMREYVMGVAAGVSGGGLRAAALRVLGGYRDELYRPHLENGLAASGRQIRLAAAVGLQRARLATGMPPLADQLLRERDSVVQTAILDAMTAIAKEHGGKLGQDPLRRATTAALRVFGRGGWQLDVAVLDFLELLRVADAVPALIDQLQRYAGGSRTADQSNLVLDRSYELLVSLTAARFGPEQIAEWRRWWAEHGDDFVVAVLKPRGATKKNAQYTVSSFFGIPVRGSRVCFVVDVSTSMNWKWSAKEQKIAVAKRELKSAVERMAADSSFNLITFAGTAQPWRSRLVPATAANKKRFFEYVDDLRTFSHTNVWGGVKIALELEVITHGSRYTSSVDEVFILSDGAPTTGEIRNPEHILATVNDTNRASKVRINTLYIEGERSGGGGGGRGGGGRGGGGRGGGGRGGGGRGGGQPNWPMTGEELMREIANSNGGVFLKPSPN